LYPMTRVIDTNLVRDSLDLGNIANFNDNAIPYRC
jgi:hypothetical protein